MPLVLLVLAPCPGVLHLSRDCSDLQLRHLHCQKMTQTIHCHCRLAPAAAAPVVAAGDPCPSLCPSLVRQLLLHACLAPLGLPPWLDDLQQLPRPRPRLLLRVHVLPRVLRAPQLWFSQRLAAAAAAASVLAAVLPPPALAALQGSLQDRAQPRAHWQRPCAVHSSPNKHLFVRERL